MGIRCNSGDNPAIGLIHEVKARIYLQNQVGFPGEKGFDDIPGWSKRIYGKRQVNRSDMSLG
uniref:Uncharacterized protein n=1 Tax=viral metagenome TaxID=1070528 RepID=A0A6H1ZBH6_9ZZZZ